MDHIKSSCHYKEGKELPEQYLCKVSYLEDGFLFPD